MNRLISLCLLILFIAGCSSESISEKKEPAQSITELRIQLREVLEKMHVPGASIAIVNKDGTLWTAGIGKSDLASNASATAKTFFRIGSVSKGFISLSILKLVEEGKLSLDDTLHKLAPEVWFENKWEATDPIRVVHLLENTTGWDDLGLREFAKDPQSMTYLEALNFDHSSRISRWRPDTRMTYSNSGPAVAAYLVEKVSGKNFEEYVSENFFKPIGMDTATYFKPNSVLTTTLYQSDGKTAHEYWNLLYRPIGSINASANDMANYLLFYLHKGKVNGNQVMPASIFDRMQSSTSTWAAKNGLSIGYGLSNYSSMYDGFLYHGHDGNVPGGQSAMVYIPNEGVGYFYSINSDNKEAFLKIGELIRSYITKNLQKPAVTPSVSLSQEAFSFTGWYEPDSPRIGLFYSFERLIGIAYMHFEDNKLMISSLGEKNTTFIPVNETEFRYVPKNESEDPAATLKLLDIKDEGKYLQWSVGLRNAGAIHITMKQIPTWIAVSRIVTFGFIVLSFLSILIYAPFWILRSQKYPNELYLKLWPLIAVSSLVCIIVLCLLSTDLFITRFGKVTAWSISLFIASLVFAAASIASLVALWRAPSDVRNSTRTYTSIVTLALMISTAYLAYYGIIGLTTWR